VCRSRTALAFRLWVREALPPHHPRSRPPPRPTRTSPLLLCLGLFESALKLRGIGGVTSLPRSLRPRNPFINSPFPIPTIPDLVVLLMLPLLTLYHAKLANPASKFRSSSTEVGVGVFDLGFPFFASGSEAFAFGNHWPSTDFFHWFNICVGESDCEGRTTSRRWWKVMKVAGISESEGIGSVDDWTAGDKDRTWHSILYLASPNERLERRNLRRGRRWLLFRLFGWIRVMKWWSNGREG